MRPSTKPCRSFAAWYSAFSERSPCERASEIAVTIAGRCTVFSSCSSARSFSTPATVMGILLINGISLLQFTNYDSRRLEQPGVQPLYHVRAQFSLGVLDAVA